jgi:hypothetical protein
MCDAPVPEVAGALELLELELPPQPTAATVAARTASVKPARLKNLSM